MRTLEQTAVGNRKARLQLMDDGWHEVQDWAELPNRWVPVYRWKSRPAAKRAYDIFVQVLHERMKSHLVPATPIKNKHGDMCGLCDGTHEHEHPTMRCLLCGAEGLAENLDNHVCLNLPKETGH